MATDSETPKQISLGVFLPIGNNGWLISRTAPQYKPSFELNSSVTNIAEKIGLDFALSMVKLRGFGGETQHWDYALESFTLTAALAATTKKIQLFASTPILALPPALCARMATTLDSIAPGRVGVNMVTGWQPAEYDQMGLWPGNSYFGYRYKYAEEYIRVMKDLWETGVSDLKGQHFTMDDCRMLPKPSGQIKVVAAGQSPTGMAFAAKYADYNFTTGTGYNTPLAFAAQNEGLVQAAKDAGRDVGAIVLFMIIAAKTDEEAEARWKGYVDGVDETAVARLQDQGKKDTKSVSEGATSTVARHSKKEQAVNFNCGVLVGSYAKVAEMLDQVATVEIKGIMMTFDKFEEGLEEFGREVQPLMKSRIKTVEGLANGA